jgi:hypothetical protein
MRSRDDSRPSLFLNLGEENRDAGLSSVGAAVRNDPFGDCVVIAGDQGGGDRLGLFRFGGELGQFFAEGFQLRENGHVLRTFFASLRIRFAAERILGISMTPLGEKSCGNLTRDFGSVNNPQPRDSGKSC